MISTYVRKCRGLELKPYCYFADKDSTIELIEWANEEGFDVEIISAGGGTKTFSLTNGEFQALQVLGNYSEQS